MACIHIYQRIVLHMLLYCDYFSMPPKKDLKKLKVPTSFFFFFLASKYFIVWFQNHFFFFSISDL